MGEEMNDFREVWKAVERRVRKAEDAGELDLLKKVAIQLKLIERLEKSQD
ncbi:MAG: hypothetical protein ACLFVL_00385 [Candidatus Aenigmatarchaeota archaeon]